MHTENRQSASKVQSKNFLNWHDIAKIFGCGKSKAMLIINEIGAVHIGQVSFVRNADLESYLAENGEIKVTWPMSSKRRRGQKCGR